MNHKMIFRFATSGMKKNRKTLLPFLIAGSVTVMIYYILVSLVYSPYLYVNGKEIFYGAQTIAILLEIASRIVGIFAFIFLLYANRFVMRDRKKEIGLYGILGLAKNHITWIMVIETILKALICIGSGLVVGTFLNKLMLLILYKIIDQPAVTGLFFVPKAVVSTLGLFVVIFGICLLFTVFSVNISSPIELLRSDQEGEKEPKVKIVLLVIGVLTLVIGYVMALRVENTSEAFSKIFPSILLVIIATYALFTAGSIAFLKMLKKNKKFYYKTRNFISVSNLIYRMKHNAAGLASICILSTAVILLLTCASSLMMLGEDNINRMFPADIKLEIMTDEVRDLQEYQQALVNAANVVGADAKNPRVYRYSHTNWNREGEQFESIDNQSLYDTAKLVDVYLMTEEDYQYVTGENVSLGDNELLYASTRKDQEAGTQVGILGNTFHIVGKVDTAKISVIVDTTMTLFEKVFLVADSRDTIYQLFAQDDLGAVPGMQEIYVGVDAREFVSEDEIMDLRKAIDQEMQKFSLPEAEQVENQQTNPHYVVKFKQVDRAFFYNMYGGAFFVGIFLAILFLMATVMIIYYKQMSEGYEDQKRYHILSNVGLTDREIRQTIRRQVMILFFLPVVTAAIHMLVAGNIVRLFLSSVLIVDPMMFYLSILVVVIVFIAVYTIVYFITSRQYYRIVNTVQ